MATIGKIGKRRRARVRKAGVPAISEIFDIKALAISGQASKMQIWRHANFRTTAL